MKRIYPTLFIAVFIVFYGSEAMAQMQPLKYENLVRNKVFHDSIKVKKQIVKQSNAVLYRHIKKMLFGDGTLFVKSINRALENKQPYIKTTPYLLVNNSAFQNAVNIAGTPASKPVPANQVAKGVIPGAGLLNNKNILAAVPGGKVPISGVSSGNPLLAANSLLNQNPAIKSSADALVVLPGPLNSAVANPLSATGSGAGSPSLLPNTSTLINQQEKMLIPQLPSASSLPLQNPLPAVNSGSSLQNLTNSPAQLLTGTNGITSTKDQMLKMAAIRSELLTGSISQNMNSINRPSLSSTLTIENDFLYQPVLGVLYGNNFENVIGVKGSLVAFGVPLSLNISNGKTALTGTGPFNSSLFKFGFSPSMLSGLMNSDLQQYNNLKNTAFHGFDFTDYVHQTVTEKVNSLETDGSKLKDSPFASDLNDPAKLQDLIKLSDQQLTEKLETETNEKYQKDLKAPNADTTKAKADRQLNYSRGDSVAAVISSIKSTLIKNGQDPDKLLLAENYSTGKTSPAFNSSETANSLYAKNPSNFMQSIMSNTKDLRVGSFGTQVPGTTGDDTKLMNGANLGIRVGDYPLVVGFGALNDINSIKDAQFETSVYTVPKNITYIGAEMNRGGAGDVKIAVVSSFDGQSNNTQYSAPTLPGNSVAFTATKAVKVDDFGNFTVDVSKSATLFSNDFQPGADPGLTTKGAASYNLSTNLFQSFAVGFTHALDIPKLEASDNIYFNYAGLGYQNPANNGYSGSTMKFGGNIKKKFYKNKLTMDFRTDYRSMPLSYTANDTWRNYQVQFDSKYQITQKFNVSLKYIDASTAQNMSGASATVYNSNKLEISANSSYKIGKDFTTSQLSISSQSLSDTYESTTSSSLVNVNYAQSLIMKNSSITGTFFYNRELSSFQMIGNLLTTDLTYQYKILRALQLGSGITYLNNTGIAQQAGIKQSLQFMAGKHFSLDASVDLRKNLITPQYADLYASTRGELSLKYYFKIN